MRPRYSTLLFHLKELIGEVNAELGQLDEDELKHPSIVPNVRAVVKAEKVVERAEDALYRASKEPK